MSNGKLYGIFVVALIAFKLAGYLTAPWIVVLAPLWIPAAGIATLVAIMVVALLVIRRRRDIQSRTRL